MHILCFCMFKICDNICYNKETNSVGVLCSFELDRQWLTQRDDDDA